MMTKAFKNNFSGYLTGRPRLAASPGGVGIRSISLTSTTSMLSCGIIELPPYFGGFATPMIPERSVLRLCLGTDIYDQASTKQQFHILLKINFRLSV
jgi:hypothetical protein